MTAPEPNFRAQRFAANPIIVPHMDARMGANVQGPSLIRVPPWIENPLGRYYLYFADHKGSYIRLAYADALAGPWRTHAPGALQLADSRFPAANLPLPPDAAIAPRAADLDGHAPAGTPGIPDPIEDGVTAHIASPDVHVDEANRRIVMYYHGLERFRIQRTRVALSADGIAFTARDELLGPSYFRVFRHGGFTYALAMPGVLLRSADGVSGFEQGPSIFEPRQRHTALLKRGDRLFVFWTRVGDVPERIHCSAIDLAGDWRQWRPGAPVEVLRPAFDWEGANLPLAPSFRGAIALEVHQLRDPAIFEEDGRTYLLYAVKGESGIAIAELFG
ncbi:MAG: hypothetical protein JNM90_08185 [Burkholderiales bacterium]|nr:hypothetical protein [Burkholderiales bacterium]